MVSFGQLTELWPSILKREKEKKMCINKLLGQDIKDVLQRGVIYFSNKY